MKAIEVEALTHRYRGHAALRDVSFSVPAGSVYALLGPNGAGKTTMLRILAGLLRPASGRATLLGRSAAKLTAADRMDIGYVAEGQALPAGMRLRELESYLAPLYDRWDQGLADELRERFRLDPARRVGRMSRGEQMKTALLVSLAPRPRVLLMDEPFTGMDVLVKDEIVRGMLGGVAEGETTVLISSHDLVELEPLADHVGFLDAGDLLLSAPMDEVRTRFRHVEMTARDPAADLHVPPGVMAEERSGRRVSFIAEDDGGLEGELRARNVESTYVDVRDVTLRELFVALAGRGGGR